ncbi:MAG: hypothetical protein ACYC56_06140 [Candidatus Aquicultor sp.]
MKYVPTLLGHADTSITLRVYSHVLPLTDMGTEERIESTFKPQSIPF